MKRILAVMLFLVLIVAASACSAENAQQGQVPSLSSSEVVQGQTPTGTYSGPTPGPVNNPDRSNAPVLTSKNPSSPGVSVTTSPVLPNTRTTNPIQTFSGALTPALTATTSPAIITVLKISVDGVKQKLDSGAGFILVDVRSRVDYDRNHIKGALSIPLQELDSRYKEISSVAEVIVYAACT
jgi:hypothetical protein